MAHRRRRLAIAAITTVAALGAAVLLLDRASVALLGEGPLDAFRPTITDILDGRTANSHRLAAIDQVVSGTIDLVTIPRMRTYGPQVYTFCSEGQNNWKVHQGYRLSCRAQSYRFIAWDGDFDDGRARILDHLRAAGCVPDREYWTNAPQKPTTGYWQDEWPPFACGGNSLYLTWANGRLLPHSADSHPIGEIFDQDDIRTIVSADGDQLMTTLSGVDWFVFVNTTTEFYRDEP